MTPKNSIVLAGRYSEIEPLALLHLDATAKQEGWDSCIKLVKDNNFKELEELIIFSQPELVGLSVTTGSHREFFRFADKLRYKSYKVVIGGHHATFFPEDTAKHSDYVIQSQGIKSFRQLLRGNVDMGILPASEIEQLPITNRRGFYVLNEGHKLNPIKNVITGQGCPFTCSHCYNSGLDGNERLFPKIQRPVSDVLSDIRDILDNSPETRLIYFQDDVFGANVGWLREFKQKYSNEFKLPFHAQVRFETIDPNNPIGKERTELIREAGCSGLTLAVESANEVVRRELLNRPMNEDLMFRTMDNLHKLGYKVRTEQMLGLPLGATREKTPINLEADLETLALNVKLKAETGLPDIAWASIYVPYRGTRLGEYCVKHGFYSGNNDDIPDSFFEKSMLRFPNRWSGEKLNSDWITWLDEEKQMKYVNEMKTLRDIFQIAVDTPHGVEFAKRFLATNQTLSNLSTTYRRHGYDYTLFGGKAI